MESIHKNGSYNFRYLGVICSYQLELEKAWEKPMAKLTATFASWRKQHLTIQGKITVIKSMALSVIAYQAQFLPATPNIIKNVENSCGMTRKKEK